MTSRGFRGDDFEHAGGRSNDFDPVAEGSRYRLAPAVSLEIWTRVCAELTDRNSGRNEEQARRRFREVAARVAARNGRLRPDPGRTTRYEMEAPGGRRERDVFAQLVPGKMTLQEVEAQRWERRLRRGADGCGRGYRLAVRARSLCAA